MEAPTYPPSGQYIRPAIESYRYGTKSVSIAELKATPKAWALVTAHIPFMPMLTEAEDIQPALGTMALEDLAVFVSILRPFLPKLNAALNELEPVPAVPAGVNA